MQSSTEFLEDYYKRILSRDGVLYGTLDKKEVGVVKLWQREDSCSQCVTEYCNYFEINNPKGGIKRGYMNEFLPNDQMLKEIREEYAKVNSH